MTAPACRRLTLADLTDYAAGELEEPAAGPVEEHLFSCGDCAARAAELDALVRAVRPAVQSAEVGGLMTDALLNRLSRDGVRVRSYVLAPGTVVPCAVWDGDELMALRLRGELGGIESVTVSHRIGGTEVSRVSADIGDSCRELILTVPAAWVRELPVATVQVLLTATNGSDEHLIGTYTLVHGGALHRQS